MGKVANSTSVGFLMVAVAFAPARLRRVAQKVQGSSVFGGIAEKNIGRKR